MNEGLHPGAGVRLEGGRRLHLGGDPRDRHGALAGQVVPVGLGLDELTEVGAWQEHPVPVGADAYLARPEGSGAHLGAALRARPGVCGVHDPTVRPRPTPRPDTRRPGPSSSHTARVTTPATGYAYLDAVFDRPGQVLAFAHRGGAFHPDIEGLENTLQAFAPRGRPRLRLSRDRRPRHQRRRAAGLPRHGPGPGHRQHRLHRRQHLRRGAAGPDQGLRAGADAGGAVRRVPRRALQHRPQVGRLGSRTGRVPRRSARPGTASAWARSRAVGCASSAG